MADVNLMTCDQLVASLASALTTASAADKAALAAAMSAAGVGGVGNNPNAGVGAYVAMSEGTSMTNGVDTVLSSYTATRAGYIAVEFNFAAISTGNIAGSSRIKKNGVLIATSSDQVGTGVTVQFISTEVVSLWEQVAVGDVITGAANVTGAGTITSATAANVGGLTNLFGLTLHYVG